MQKEARMPLHALNNKGSGVADAIKDSSSDITVATTKSVYSAHYIDVHKCAKKSKNEELAANKEYILTLKNALREVIEENEMVWVFSSCGKG